MVVSLSLFCEVLAIVFCLHYLYDEEVRFEPVTIGFVLVEVIWMYIINLLQLDQKWSLMVYPMVILFCSWRFGLFIKTIFVNTILYTIILSSLQATLMLLFRVVVGELRIVEQLVINIVVLLFVVFFLKKCKLYKLSLILQKRERIVVIAISIVVISIFVFLLNYKQNIGFDIFYYVVLLIDIFLMGVVVIDIGKHKLKAAEAEAELRLHKLYGESFQSLIQDIRAKQHEFDNHINTIFSQHFVCQTYDELVSRQMEYCEEIVEENKFNKLLGKGNSIVLGFLYGKFVEADRKGIKVNYKVSFDKLECTLPNYKIVEILGNLINNAMEELLVNQMGKEVFIEVQESDEKIRIEVSNPVKEVNYVTLNKYFDKGYSSKETMRGYGLYNVKKICEEYKIDLQCNYKKISDIDWIVFLIEINKKRMEN